MKQEFIIRKGSERLTIFFAGWGMDAAPFKPYVPAQCDLMVCYDYCDMSFDSSMLEPYRSAHVVGWSMGVWAAEQTEGQIKLPAKYTAVNGTPFPIDEKRGIPPAIFYGTLRTLSDATLQKFRRRMCGDAETLQRFMESAPQREKESLRIELSAIADKAQGYIPAAGLWDEACIGSRDMIFPASNQKEAWRQLGCPVTETDAAHYSEDILKKVLG